MAHENREFVDAAMRLGPKVSTLDDDQLSAIIIAATHELIARKGGWLIAAWLREQASRIEFFIGDTQGEA